MIALLVVLANGTAIATFPGASSRPAENLRAETLAIPDTLTPAAFADQIIEAEGIVAWNREEPTRSARLDAEKSWMNWKSRVAGNGREITVFYMSTARHVCIIRRDGGGATETQWAALRWCAASFGIAAPEKRPPAIVTVPTLP